MPSPTSSGVTLGRVAVLVVVPVVIFAALAVGLVMVVGTLAVLSAMGHGTLTDDEARPVWIAGWTIAAVVTAGTVLWLERWLMGPRASRAAAQRVLTIWTRAAVAVIAVMLPIAAPPVIRAAVLERKVYWARHGAVEGRSHAISDLSHAGTPRAYRTLRDIAVDPREDAYLRSQAAYGLANYPDAKEPLLVLAADPEPHVRASAAAGLLVFADDPRAWAVVERLARDERALIRDPVQAALRQGRIHPAARDKRTRLLEEIARSAAPGEALAAAAEVGAAGFDRALALFEDVSKDDVTRLKAIKVLGQLEDPRALDRLHQIVVGRTEAGLVPVTREDDYRQAAASAISQLQGIQPHGEELLVAYYLERSAVVQTREVLKGQAAYAAATGFFDARLTCLELPATCGAGRDPDETFLAPYLTRDTRHGYVHRLEPGPRPAPDELAARRASPTSVRGFAYVSVPEVRGETGLRGFCADDSGAICFTRDGRRPGVRNGRCLLAPAPEASTAPRMYEPVDRECEAAR